MATFDLDSVIKSKSKARLIPTLADSNLEQRLTSIILAAFCIVPDFAKECFETLGIRIGVRSKLSAYCEVVFKSKDARNARPDGLLIIQKGKSTWTALIESKVKNNEITEDQVQKYASLAKKHGIDALITISNQFVSNPRHHPVYKNTKTGFQVFHWSWQFLLTQAILIGESTEESDPEQQFILAEVYRYMKDPSSGVREFNSMNSDWRELVTTLGAGGRISSNDEMTIMAASDWHQLCRDISLQLTKDIAVIVAERIPLKHRKDAAKRLKEDCKSLAKTDELHASFLIPDAAAPLNVTANLRRRTITCNMRLSAPTNKKTAKARLNWLLRQLRNHKLNDLYIRLILPGGANNPVVTLDEAVENPDSIIENLNGLVPTSFEVRTVSRLGAKFLGPQAFVASAKELPTLFYDKVGENLKAWVPPAPKLMDPKERVENQGKRVAGKGRGFLTRIIQD